MTDLSPAARAEIAAAWRAFVIVAILVPVIVTLAGAAVVIAWLPQLPDPIATHWSGTEPDGFEPKIFMVFMTLGMGFSMTALFSGIVWFEMRNRPETWGSMQRFLGALTPAVVVGMTVMFVGSVEMQRGLTDARDAGSVDSMLAIGGATALVVGLLAWAVQPKVEFAKPEEPADAESLALAPNERAVWIGEARMGRGVFVSLGLLLLILIGMTVTMLAVGDEAWWILLLTVVVVLIGIAATTAYRVRIDATGIRVRAFFGWPRFHYGPDRIRAAAVGDIAPMAQYGGWGLRLIPGSTGVITRGGEAIVVTLTNDRTFVVTVDDAAVGAALLQAVVAGQGNAASGADKA